MRQLRVQNARRDHFDFIDKMRDRDVEVVELHDALTETMKDPARRPGCWTAQPCTRTRSSSAVSLVRASRKEQW